MNHLAHAVFANGSKLVVFGAVAADSWKRMDTSFLPQGIQDGRVMHAVLDNLTADLIASGDFPAFSGAKSLIHNAAKSDQNSGLSHHSDAGFDVCCDYVIASNWDKLFATPLRDYVDDFYRIARENAHYLPEDRRIGMLRMIEGDWLMKYAEPYGVSNALNRIADRVKHGDRIRNSIPYILDTLPHIAGAVLDVVPHIRKHTDHELTKLGYERDQRLLWKDEITLSPEGNSPSFKER